MSADEANGLVYLPVSSPSPNYYWGGNRVDAIPLGTSTTALDINTGRVVWSRQWVHHDVWDYDINSAPDADGHHRRRQADPGAGAGHQAAVSCLWLTA